MNATASFRLGSAAPVPSQPGQARSAAAEPVSLAEQVASAIEEAGNLPYSISPGHLVGRVSHVTLTYRDGSGSFDFESADDARAHVHQRRRLAMAHAALRVVTGTRKASLERGLWKVVVNDWGCASILPHDGTLPAIDSVAEFNVRRPDAGGRERAIALAEHFVAAANVYAAAAAPEGAPHG